jgi:hypothetical protein
MPHRRKPATPPEHEDESVLSMHVTDVRRGEPHPDGFVPVVQETTRGEIEMRYYPVPGAARGAVVVGGAGGGFDTPVRGWLYPRLCQELRSDGVACLRVRYRDSHELEESVLDVLAGISFLEADGVTCVALVGHSFGGAVVIQAAALSPAVVACAPLSTQSYGAAPAADLGPRCALFLAHGLADEILPPTCSEYVHRIAKEPKELHVRDGVRHGLDEWSEELPGMLRTWIRTRLEGENV